MGFAAFFISRVVPADPAAAALGQNAREEQIEAYREKFGLNDPVPVQYVSYMGNLFRGDLGVSLRTRRPDTRRPERLFSGDFRAYPSPRC